MHRLGKWRTFWEKVRTKVRQAHDRAPAGSGRPRGAGERSELGVSERMAGVTGLEPAASGVTGQRSNRLSYTPARGA